MALAEEKEQLEMKRGRKHVQCLIVGIAAKPVLFQSLEKQPPRAREDQSELISEEILALELGEKDRLSQNPTEEKQML